MSERSPRMGISVLRQTLQAVPHEFNCDVELGRSDTCDCSRGVAINALGALEARGYVLSEALKRIAEGKSLSLLLSMTPSGEWTTRDEVYENIARAALDAGRTRTGVRGLPDA